MKVSIVIPAYNEEKRIGKTLHAYSEFFEKIKKQKILDYELLVVINNTKDKTEDVVKICQKSNKNIKYLNFKQGGKGFAVRKGFESALQRNFDLIGFVDADMATPPEQFYRLIEGINGADGAIASRNIIGSQIYSNSGFRRVIVSRIFNFLTRFILLLPYRDTQCGAKLFKRGTIEKILPKMTMSKWAFDIDILYIAKKLKFYIKEVPTIWYEAKGAKINVFTAGPWMLLGVVRLRIINSPFKFFIRLYDNLLFKLTKFINCLK